MEDIKKKYEENIERYKKYKMFSYDFLFYQGIYMLYFTLTKGFTLSQIIIIGAFFYFFTFIWQIPANMFIEKIGLRRSIIIGNVLVIFEVLMYLLAKDYSWVIFGDFFGSLGFSLKHIAEGALLYSSLKKNGEVKKFAKVEGKSHARFYYYDAFSSFFAGFLFLINPYLPMMLTFANTIISLFMSISFNDIKKIENLEEMGGLDLKGQIVDWKKIFRSRRAISLLLFSFFFTGIITVCNKFYMAIMQDMGITAQYISMIICIVTIYSGIGTREMYRFERRAKNKTLTIFAIVFVVSAIFIGVIGAVSSQNFFTIALLIILMLLLGVITGAYRVAIKKYFLSFTNSRVRTKVLSAYYIFENLGRTFLLFLTGLLLKYQSAAVSSVMFSVVSLIIMMLIVLYMKDRVGRRPEEYPKQEIYGD